jgi:F0F1-type ATP synthase epsilon subunit
MDDLAGSPATGDIQEGEADTKTDKSRAPTMHVKVYSPSRTYFDEMASSISGENATGPFDILPHHHNFISLLRPCELTVRRLNNGAEQRIKISGGIMHVKADRVIVFLDI